MGSSTKNGPSAKPLIASPPIPPFFTLALLSQHPPQHLPQVLHEVLKMMPRARAGLSASLHSF